MTDLNHKINNLSVMEQSLGQLINQKRNFQNDLLDVESALNELNEDVSFKIIGNFMFKKKGSDLKSELMEKKDLLNARIKSFEKQEKDVELKFKELQSEVLKELSSKKNAGEKK